MKVRADELKKALSIRHQEDFYLTEVKTGATHVNSELLKFDVMAVKKSWANPCITGYEIKVDRSDFLRDYKWPGYMAYCNQFSFVCPTGLITLEELPADVGLIYFNAEKGSLTTKRKAVYRNITIPESLLYYLIMNRLDNDRHPFFSSRREYIEAYMADKDERVELGRRFGLKVSEELSKLRDEVRNLNREKERTHEDLEMFSQMRFIIREYGISLHRWGDWQNELRAALNGQGVSPKVTNDAKKILQLAESLLKSITPSSASAEEVRQ